MTGIRLAAVLTITTKSPYAVRALTELLDGELGSGPGSTDQVWTEATGALKTALRSTSIADLADRESDVGSPMYYI